MSYRKYYLRIQVVFSPDGSMTPVCFEWHDGRVDIDRILSAAQRPPKNVGAEGACIEYRCMIYGQVRQIYFEEEHNRWFIEIPEREEEYSEYGAD